MAANPILNLAYSIEEGRGGYSGEEGVGERGTINLLNSGPSPRDASYGS